MTSHELFYLILYLPRMKPKSRSQTNSADLTNTYEAETALRPAAIGLLLLLVTLVSVRSLVLIATALL